MNRPASPDQYATTNVFDNATLIAVTNGTNYAGTCWGMDPAQVVTVDTTGQTLTRVALPPVQARVASEGINYALGSTFTSFDGVSTGSTPPLQGNGLAGSDIVLLKDQTDPTENGLYWVNTGGALTGKRCSEPLVPSRGVRISEGTQNAQTRWIVVTQGAITVGTTALSFSAESSLANLDSSGGVAIGDVVGASPTAGKFRKATNSILGALIATSTADASGTPSTTTITQIVSPAVTGLTGGVGDVIRDTTTGTLTRIPLGAATASDDFVGVLDANNVLTLRRVGGRPTKRPARATIRP
jgi:hypothetical protein